MQDDIGHKSKNVRSSCFSRERLLKSHNTKPNLALRKQGLAGRPHLALFLVEAVEEADFGVVAKVAHGLQLLLLRQIVRQLELRADLPQRQQHIQGGNTTRKGGSARCGFESGLSDVAL